MALFEQAPDPFVVTDLTGAIQAVNGAARAVLDHSDAGEPIECLFVRSDRPDVLRALGALVHGTARQCDLRVVLEGQGVRRPVWVRAARTEWGTPPEPAVHWILRELGVLEASHDRLLRTTALKDAYLLALAHDLRTPVAVLRGVADLLRKSPGDEERVDVLTDVLRQTVREIDGIITDLLDVERLEHEGVDVQRHATDLRALVQRCVETVGLAHLVETDVPPGSVNVDAALVERILVNVLANARHHGPPDEKVRLAAAVDEQGVRLQIDDRGPGIPGEAKEAVFDLFHQLSSGGSGVGVGLYLVRRFAVLHGGWATIADAPDGGTSVQVRLAT